MKRLFILLLVLFTGCEMKYWGLVPDTISVDATVDLDSSVATVRLVKKYMGNPVMFANVYLNSVFLDEEGPGEYRGNINPADTFHLRIEGMDELLNFTEHAPEPRNVNYEYEFSGDTLFLRWQKANFATYYNVRILRGDSVIFSSETPDTLVRFPVNRDTLRLELTVVSGPELGDTSEVNNINTGVWEGILRIKKTTRGFIYPP